MYNFYAYEKFDFIYVLCRPNARTKECNLRLVGEYNPTNDDLQLERIMWDETDVTKAFDYIFDEWDGSFYRHIKEVIIQHLEKSTFVDVEESDHTMQNQ
jgi:5-methylcytosine-specific restriction endonuclease McrBC GTP-binding regulatory subunit McrB